MNLSKKIICIGLCAAMSVMSLTACSYEDIDSELSYRNLGLKQMAAGEYESAIDSFEKALDQSVGHVRNLEEDIILNVSECMYRSGRAGDALTRLDALIDFDKSCAGAYFLRGNINLEQGLQTEALDDYKKAAKYDGGSYELFLQLYENLKAKNMMDEANEYLDRALGLKGNSRYDLTSRGYIYYLLGDYETARDLLEEACSKELKKGEDDKAELYLAQVESILGNEEAAQQHYISYGDKHQDDPIVLAQLGHKALAEGEYEVALRYYQQGLASDNLTNERELMKGEIAALEYTGNFEEARAAVAQYVLDFPDDEEVLREQVFLKYR